MSFQNLFSILKSYSRRKSMKPKHVSRWIFLFSFKRFPIFLMFPTFLKSSCRFSNFWYKLWLLWKILCQTNPVARLYYSALFCRTSGLGFKIRVELFPVGFGSSWVWKILPSWWSWRLKSVRKKHASAFGKASVSNAEQSYEIMVHYFY